MISKVTSTAAELAKVAPVGTILWWNAFIAAVPTIIMLLTLGYLLLQIGYLVWKWKKDVKDGKNGKGQ